MSLLLTLQALSKTDIVLTSDRLRLRGFTLSDVSELTRLADNKKIHETTARVPHPYTHTDATQWIESHQEQRSQNSGLNWAVTTKDSATLLGTCGLTIRAGSQAATLGYWIGVPYWRHGYGSEAALLVTSWALGMGVKVLDATCVSNNPASIQILERCGFRRQQLRLQEEIRPGVLANVLHFVLDSR